jgi:hypothetical protein
MKHVGKMKNNGAPVAVVFRTIPGDPQNCLVVGTQGLGPTYHDSLMQLIETPEAQGSFELGTILGVRRFPDNSPMLAWLHSNGKLTKVPTSNVDMTFSPQQLVQLDELNKIIAEQRGIKVEELAYIGTNEKPAVTQTEDFTKTTSQSVNSEEVQAVAVPQVETGILDDSTLAKRLGSEADAMFKEAQNLRKQADDLDPPAKKVAKVEVTEAKAKTPAKKTTKKVAA